jgi:hypothetical protein
VRDDGLRGGKCSFYSDGTTGVEEGEWECWELGDR